MLLNSLLFEAKQIYNKIVVVNISRIFTFELQRFRELTVSGLTICYILLCTDTHKARNFMIQGHVHNPDLRESRQIIIA